MKNSDLQYLKKYLPSDRYEEGLSRLKKGEPVQYIVGNVNFYGNEIMVNKKVLIPRFETELLVEKTVKLINKYFDEKVSILDIGTGSGCIAIALKKIIDCDIEGIDISEDALDVARKNSELNMTNVTFYQSDVFSNVNNKYDVIISNPPYIAYDEEIMEVVKNNEPHIALYADDEGLYFYNLILKECQRYLNNKFIIALEIGEKQGQAIEKMAYKYFNDDISVKVEKDYSNKDRYVFISNLL